ncbi:zona pellucida-like domain-containing protein 1 [Acanthochromis polyacanthus]|uniref:zona pellucida-like domain-containing protein 1 n=1 Tax=Acanthochromis polyacanthus TaxID=80966 RepID=UPI0022349746|nr:zona pellucida-like domain-containing protein 1 [Acanthochromis polyacanthus]
MRLVILVCQLGLILRTDAQIPPLCVLSDTNRAPENTDIKVVCGTKYMKMDIYICPIYQAAYNESLMVLNGQINNPDCYGTPDWNASPPVLKFRFPINATSGKSFCDNSNKITSERGEGVFADFSNVQYVNISGAVVSIDPTAGTITYRKQIMYRFSCKYAMQYLLNNTEVAVSGVSLAIRDNNGSFISTLSMALYSDANYNDLLIVPQTGLSLKTKIYVAVHATNLTQNFHVLLDRCFATTKAHPFNSTHHDLFVGCTFDGQTKVELNGKGQKAYFSFEAFRFVEHKNLTVSTFYVHCAVRLCKDEDCERLSVSRLAFIN